MHKAPASPSAGRLCQWSQLDVEQEGFGASGLDSVLQQHPRHGSPVPDPPGWGCWGIKPSRASSPIRAGENRVEEEQQTFQSTRELFAVMGLTPLRKRPAIIFWFEKSSITPRQHSQKIIKSEMQSSRSSGCSPRGSDTEPGERSERSPINSPRLFTSKAFAAFTPSFAFVFPRPFPKPGSLPTSSGLVIAWERGSQHNTGQAALRSPGAAERRENPKRSCLARNPRSFAWHRHRPCRRANRRWNGPAGRDRPRILSSAAALCQRRNVVSAGEGSRPA